MSRPRMMTTSPSECSVRSHNTQHTGIYGTEHSHKERSGRCLTLSLSVVMLMCVDVVV
jgi:hypothetical protein